MMLAGYQLRGMADAASGGKPGDIARRMSEQAADFVHVIAKTPLARKAAAGKAAARGLNRIVVPVLQKSAGRTSTIRFGTNPNHRVFPVLKFLFSVIGFFFWFLFLSA